MNVRALEPDDAPAVIALRREALTASPLAFGHRWKTIVASRLDRQSGFHEWGAESRGKGGS